MFKVKKKVHRANKSVSGISTVSRGHSVSGITSSKPSTGNRNKKSGDKKSTAGPTPVSKPSKTHQNPPPPEPKPVPDKCHDFKKGEILKSGKGIRWKLGSKLGEGGFGMVFKVYCNPNNAKCAPNNDEYRRFFAMKMEKNAFYTDKGKHEDIDREALMMRLKVEVAVLKEIERYSKQKKINFKHFAKIIDMGETENNYADGLGVKFIVMTLLGKSLADIRTQMPNKEFTLTTVCKIFIQAVEALSDLHSMGFIHRDLKPANLSPGTGAKENILFLLDFGIVKRIATFNNDKLVLHTKTKMPTKKRIGTPDYMSVNALNDYEQSYVDDLESLLYVMCDLFDGNYGKPWVDKTIKEEDKKKKYNNDTKKRLMKGDFQVFAECFLLKQKKPEDGYIDVRIPEEFKKTVALVNSTKYENMPNYKEIIESFKEMATAFQLNLADDFDWIGMYPEHKFIDHQKEVKQNEKK